MAVNSLRLSQVEIQRRTPASRIRSSDFQWRNYFGLARPIARLSAFESRPVMPSIVPVGSALKCFSNTVRNPMLQRSKETQFSACLSPVIELDWLQFLQVDRQAAASVIRQTHLTYICSIMPRDDAFGAQSSTVQFTSKLFRTLVLQLDRDIAVLWEDDGDSIDSVSLRM